MPREASGTVEWRADKNGVECWHVRVSLRDGTRPWVPMPGIPQNAEGAAALQGRAISRRMRNGGAVRDGTGETLSEYFARWLRARERRGLRSARNDEGRFGKWIAPHLGTRPIAGPDGVTSTELKALVLALDRDVAAKRLSWKTAVSVWGVVTKLFDDACRSKDPALCVRSDNPARDVRGPERGADKEAPFLYPREVTKLLACEGVPLHGRRIYALATYLYLRGGELAALQWDAVNFDLGYVLIHQALNTDTGKVKSTKTKRIRKVPIEPSLVPLLRAMRAESDGEGAVVEMPSFSEWASGLRRHLQIAGVTRAELFADDDTRRQLSFHDLRHTGITWRAVRGDDAKKLQRAAGHSTSAQTDAYINEAEVFDRDAFGEPFPPLPATLLDESSGNCPRRVQVRETTASPGGFERHPGAS